ncbi:phosphotransferase [uncultured Methylobacterium sp.]|mgnify:CR=1 FL=1|jgi:aminoglycoside phosphotransferase (APT) family kinase protein|uniref:phosphotransferase n=1 Tax=uncultured Methylobacterium sp. TaxID=157278 RepID=UPI00262C1BA6|nr:phosphotransferase [uncultured Methylobacterium sp.]
MSALPETIPVREAHRFPTEALDAFLAAQGLGGLKELRQMRGGQSNPTFLVETPEGEYVLRKQPPGKLLPSAHAVDREFRVLNALRRTDVPVPAAVAFCADPAVIGTPFYLMERLRGRVFWDPALPDLPKEERAGIYVGMNEALARLHRVDPAAIGLSDFGKAGNYFKRQTDRWSSQWSASKTRDNPSIDRLAEWLPAHIPDSDETRICHGDFRLDNMIFHPSEPRVIGIIDWELATLGHPLADLAYNCIAYNTAPTAYRGLYGRDLAELGIPSQDEYVARYCERTGRPDGITPFHLAFALFRLAVILEGVLARAKAGNASSDEASEKGALGVVLADRAWEIARGR